MCADRSIHPVDCSKRCSSIRQWSHIIGPFRSVIRSKMATGWLRPIRGGGDSTLRHGSTAEELHKHDSNTWCRVIIHKNGLLKTPLKGLQAKKTQGVCLYWIENKNTYKTIATATRWAGITGCHGDRISKCQLGTVVLCRCGRPAVTGWAHVNTRVWRHRHTHGYTQTHNM